MPPKRIFSFQKTYPELLGLRITSRDPQTGAVESCVCRFCESFGRETVDDTSDGSRKRKRTTNKQHWSKSFRPDNIRKHMLEQHPTRWEQYQRLRQAKDEDPSALSTFFSQTVVEAYFEKRSVIDNGKLYLAISKDVVEVVIKEMLFDSSELLAGDIAMSAFVPITQEHADGSTETVSYQVVVKNQVQFDYVVSLIACGLSFRQISLVVKENRDKLGTAAKTGCVSPGEAANISRIVCATSLQLISDLMNASWAFSIAADASTDDFNNSHLDTRVRLPPVAGSDELLSFHLLAIPLFNESHSGESLFDITSKLLGALCPAWRDKIIAASTDGAPNMTGCIQGFTTRLQNESSSAVFYRVWCLAHQLDLVAKQAVCDIADLGGVPFMSTLTQTVAWLRRQDILIRRMKSKCPYYINVRWTSLAKVLKWLTSNRTQVTDYFDEKSFSFAPSKAW